MTISPQSHFQNEIQNSAESMIEYKRNLQQCIDKKTYNNVQLTVVSSATLQKGQIVLLNPLGLCSKNERSLREISQDGVQMPQD